MKITTEKQQTGKNGNPTPKGFSKGQSGNPNGRPPKLLKELNILLQKQGYESLKPSQIQEAFQLILNLPETKLKEISKDKANPYFLRILIKKLLSPNPDTLVDKILDRIMGKALISIDHSTQGGQINILTPPTMSFEEWEKKTQTITKQI